MTPLASLMCLDLLPFVFSDANTASASCSLAGSLRVLASCSLAMEVCSCAIAIKAICRCRSFSSASFALFLLVFGVLASGLEVEVGDDMGLPNSSSQSSSDDKCGTGPRSSTSSAIDRDTSSSFFSSRPCRRSISRVMNFPADRFMCIMVEVVPVSDGCCPYSLLGLLEEDSSIAGSAAAGSIDDRIDAECSICSAISFSSSPCADLGEIKRCRSGVGARPYLGDLAEKPERVLFEAVPVEDDKCRFIMSRSTSRSL
mmetsp:Transcript_53499/g.81146  ORF Transcript_53499/g.81146 Transcript_53499/m.81146 type:complete len:257 (-) Transcript_53499:1406-2176(-)